MTPPFDPIERAKETESLVIQGRKRAYYRARFSPRFDCPVTMDSCGCCLNCAYCWNYQRNQDLTIGKFYSPEEIAEKALRIAKKEKEWRFRISGCEAILGRASASHFSEVASALVDGSPNGSDPFILLETNGIMLGYDHECIEILKPHRNHMAVRVALKGETPEMYEKISGAMASSFQYQLRSLEWLYEAEIPSLPAIMSTFMDSAVVSELTGIVESDIDQERLKFYPATKKVLIERGCWEMRKPTKKEKEGKGA
jgi:uncharacterized Fe-S cluster-containing radical SAM superfamily protein